MHHGVPRWDRALCSLWHGSVLRPRAVLCGGYFNRMHHLHSRFFRQRERDGLHHVHRQHFQHSGLHRLHLMSRQLVVFGGVWELHC